MMLTTNLFNKANNEAMVEIATAIKAEGWLMMVKVLEDKETALEKKIENKNGTATPEMIEGYKSELEEVRKEITNLINKAGEVIATVEKVEAIIDKKLIKILACAENSKFEKYAIEWTDEDAEDLYDAMCNIHGISDEVDNNNIKKSTDIIEKIVRLNLSFAETDLTEKVTVRLNKSDFKLINETWVRGSRNTYKKSKKEGTIEYKSTELKFVVSKRQKKNEDAVYDWSRFNAVLVQIVLAKIANI